MALRRVELTPGGKELKISFPYDERLLPLVRSFPGRRFDRDERAWFCPSSGVVEVVQRLREESFELEGDVLELYRKEGGPASPSPSPSPAAQPLLFGAPPAEAPLPGAAPERTSITVRELNAKVRRAVRQAFPQAIWLVGELSGFDRNHHRRHVYFELVEKEGPGDEAVREVKATVSAVLFEAARERIEARLKAEGPGLELQDGVEVRVQVSVDLYEPRGAFQVIVEDLDPLHTLGKLAQNRERVLAELDRLGIREKNLRRPLPDLPLRVGLITSAGSDAYNDFVNELSRSGYSFELTLVHAAVQGRELESQVVRALQYFSGRAPEFDVVALVRGGGARTDLMWFDSLKVAQAVATCPIKIISGIGHHRDVSVVDLIAHREKTPTAAAAALVDRVRRQEERLQQSTRAFLGLPLRLQEQRRRLGQDARALARTTRGRVGVEIQRLLSHRHSLAPQVRHHLHSAHAGAAAAARRLRDLLRGQTQLQARLLTEATRRLVRAAPLRLQRHGQGLAEQQRLLASLDPRAVLRRGFALVQDPTDRYLRRPSEVLPGQVLRITLAEGELRATAQAPDPRQGNDGGKDPQE